MHAQHIFMFLEQLRVKRTMCAALVEKRPNNTAPVYSIFSLSIKRNLFSFATQYSKKVSRETMR
jgi:hypothetical protein